MRFGDFLKATVLLSAGTATLLAAVTVIGLSRDDDRTLLVFCAVWWIGAVLIGIWLGRRAETSPPIRRLLLGAKSQTTLPELRPGMTIANRLWPLLLSTFAATAATSHQPAATYTASGSRSRVREITVSAASSVAAPALSRTVALRKSTNRTRAVRPAGP